MHEDRPDTIEFDCVFFVPALGYHIAIKTGSINGASSDSKVFVKLYGEKGDTNKMLLVVSDNDLGNYFETGQTDIFTIETFDIGGVCFLFMFSTFTQSKVPILFYSILYIFFRLLVYICSIVFCSVVEIHSILLN